MTLTDDVTSAMSTSEPYCLNAQVLVTKADKAADFEDLTSLEGYTVAVATNPIFPEIATQSRLRWAGLEGVTFPLVTTFETSTYAKPNPEYYRQVCDRLGVQPKDCIHIGNDVLEDGAAKTLGVEVLLIEDCLVNEKQLPTEGFSMGSLEDLLAWAEALPSA